MTNPNYQPFIGFRLFHTGESESDVILFARDFITDKLTIVRCEVSFDTPVEGYDANTLDIFSEQGLKDLAEIAEKIDGELHGNEDVWMCHANALYESEVCPTCGSDYKGFMSDKEIDDDQQLDSDPHDIDRDGAGF